MARFKIFNGPMPTIASQAAVTTGTSIKTLLQLKPFNTGKIIAWGITFDGAPSAIEVELCETGTIFATVTASADADIYKVEGADNVAASVAGLTLSTTGTGYTASGEGTVVAVKEFDVQFLSTNTYVYQFPLGQEPKLLAGSAYRIRVKAAAAVNALAWMEIDT